MTRSIRWRIIVLQIVALLVLAFGSGAGFVANSFTTTQIHDQLAAQQIYFPQNAAQGLPKDLTQYAGQQVLTGDQAHAYAEKYIALHLSEIGQGHPYSYWSNQARAATDPAVAAKDQGIADTLFKGETLRSMLKSVGLGHGVGRTSSAQNSAHPSLNANPWLVPSQELPECERRYQNLPLSRKK